jgi:hypothetical protein
MKRQKHNRYTAVEAEGIKLSSLPFASQPRGDYGTSALGGQKNFATCKVFLVSKERMVV